MAETLSRDEAFPSSYPDAPAGLSADAAALSADMIWQRIEAYVAHRWTERDVVWIVEGPGDWCPDLTPSNVTTTELWSATGAWEAVQLNPSPLGGYQLQGSGPYRFTATTADEDVPELVLEAFRRLAEYMATTNKSPGAKSRRVSSGSIDIAETRSASWMAQAMQNSGAGDLLRNYRRA